MSRTLPESSQRKAEKEASNPLPAKQFDPKRFAYAIDARASHES